MALNYVTLVLDRYDGGGSQYTLGYASLAPSMEMPDPGDRMLVGQAPVLAAFRAGSLPQVKLVSTDSIGPQPNGWTWNVTYSGVPGSPAAASYYLPAGPASYTATNASPCVFTFTATSSLTVLPNGTGVQLAGSPPAGFTGGTTYYVVNVSGSTFNLAASQGGSAIASTGTGSGTLVVVQYNLSALASTPAAQPGQQYLPLPTGTPSSGQVPVATGSGEASAWGSVPGNRVGLAPVGTQGAGGDAANINGLIALTGKAVLQAGQFWLESPVIPLQNNYTWIDGAGDGITILSPANGANCDVIQGAGFSSLTGTGTVTATGAGPFLQVSNLTIDGNRSNQTLTALTNAACNPATPPPNGYGLRLYGRNWKLTNVDVRNCFAYGIWTEWGTGPGNAVNLTGSVEGRAINLKVYENGVHGWYHRGPTDCQIVNTLCYQNNQAGLNAGIDFWAEADGVTNGSGTGKFSPNGLQLISCHFWGGATNWNLVLDCNASTAACHAEGASTGCALFRGTVKWTGGSDYYVATQSTSWGCGVQFGDTGSTTGVPTTASYTANIAYFGVITGQMCDVASRAGIVWANCNQSIVDALIITQAIPTGLVGSGSNGQTLPQSSIAFTSGPALPPNGVVSIADTGGPDTVTYTGNTGASLTGCTGGTHTLATGNVITLKNVGTVAVSGTVDAASDVAIEVTGTGLVTGVAQLSSTHYHKGVHRIDIGSQSTGFRITNNGADAFNVNTASTRFESPGGYEWRMYSDAYVTPTVKMQAASGHIGFALPNGASLGIAAAGGAGSSPPTPTLQSLACDTQGEVNMGTGTGPSNGSQATLTFATSFGAAPVIVLTPVNAATAALQPYVSSPSSSGFNIAFANSPAASQSVGTYIVNYIVIARGS